MDREGQEVIGPKGCGKQGGAVGTWDQAWLKIFFLDCRKVSAPWKIHPRPRKGPQTWQEVTESFYAVDPMGTQVLSW